MVSHIKYNTQFPVFVFKLLKIYCYDLEHVDNSIANEEAVHDVITWAKTTAVSKRIKQLASCGGYYDYPVLSTSLESYMKPDEEDQVTVSELHNVLCMS